MWRASSTVHGQLVGLDALKTPRTTVQTHVSVVARTLRSPQGKERYGQSTGGVEPGC